MRAVRWIEPVVSMLLSAAEKSSPLRKRAVAPVVSTPRSGSPAPRSARCRDPLSTAGMWRAKSAGPPAPAGRAEHASERALGLRERGASPPEARRGLRLPQERLGLLEVVDLAVERRQHDLHAERAAPARRRIARDGLARAAQQLLRLDGAARSARSARNCVNSSAACA
jgi:hypothetical protein